MLRLYSLLVLVLGLAVAGCDDEVTPPSQSGSIFSPLHLWGSSTTPTYGQFYITAQTGSNGETTYLSGGKIYSSTAHATQVSGGDMTAGGLVIPWNANLAYYAIGPEVGGGGTPTFGAVSTWGLAGNGSNGIPSFADSLYVPAVIKLTAPVGPNGTVSKSGAISVQWNADVNNSDGVAVGLMYDGVTSQFVDSTLPYFEYNWYQFTDDDGSYTIPASVLNSIPVGGYVNIVVARGASKEVGTVSKRFHIYGYSVGSGLFKVTI